MKGSACEWFTVLGFVVIHTPGVSRAWQKELADGSCLLVTDVGGFDLPDAGGPYSCSWLSLAGALKEWKPHIRLSRDLFRWLRHIERRFQTSAVAVTAGPFGDPSDQRDWHDFCKLGIPPHWRRTRTEEGRRAALAR